MCGWMLLRIWSNRGGDRRGRLDLLGFGSKMLGTSKKKARDYGLISTKALFLMKFTSNKVSALPASAYYLSLPLCSAAHVHNIDC